MALFLVALNMNKYLRVAVNISSVLIGKIYHGKFIRFTLNIV